MYKNAQLVTDKQLNVFSVFKSDDSRKMNKKFINTFTTQMFYQMTSALHDI